MANYRLRDDVTQEQLNKGRDTAKKRSGFVLYHDYLGTLKDLLSFEQIGAVIIALGEYATSFEETPFSDPVLDMAYKMGINGINRDVEKYAASCANHSAGALERERKKRGQAKTASVEPPAKDEEEEMESKPSISFDTTLRDALDMGVGDVRTILQSFAKAHDWWIPSNTICRGVEQHIRMVEDYSLLNILDFLKRNFQGETDENAIEAMFDQLWMQWKKNR